MLAKNLHDLQTVLRAEGIMFAYSGYITEPILSGVGDALKKKLAFEDADTKTARSVFAVFVEQMQNIIRYSADKEPPGNESSSELRYGVMTISHVDGDYVVNAGNMVNRGDIDRMRERLQEISAMDKAQLKIAYKTQLKSEPDEYSKGAGLGFLEIARRASKPIEFDFTELDESHAFFALKARI